MLLRLLPTRTCFYPRSRTGSDDAAVIDRVLSELFLSTLPHGERLNGDYFAFIEAKFLSTLPHGERPLAS